MIKDRYGNRYIAAKEAVFKLEFSGVSTALLTLESMPASLSISSLYPSNLAIDDLGNLYFSLQNTISSLYRLNADGGVELLLDETGDGTGKVVCVSSADASEVDLFTQRQPLALNR